MCLATPNTSEPLSNDAYSALLSTEDAAFGALTDPIDEPEGDPKPDNDLYRSAVRRAGERMILAAGKHFRACRDARAALRPDLAGSLIIQVEVRPDGTPSKVQVTASRIPDNDDVLNRCVATVVNGLRFAETTLTGTVDVTLRFDLPGASGWSDCRAPTRPLRPTSMPRTAASSRLGPTNASCWS